MKIAFNKAKGGLQDWFIRLWTRGPYSHCELVFDDGMWFSSSPKDGGVRFKVKTPSDEWDYLEIEVNEEAIRFWCNTQSGAYDWFGIARFVLPFLAASETKWFCSELCLSALQEAGMFTDKKASCYSPNALYKLIARKV